MFAHPRALSGLQDDADRAPCECTELGRPLGEGIRDLPRAPEQDAGVRADFSKEGAWSSHAGSAPHKEHARTRLPDRPGWGWAGPAAGSHVNCRGLLQQGHREAGTVFPHPRGHCHSTQMGTRMESWAGLHVLFRSRPCALESGNLGSSSSFPSGSPCDVGQITAFAAPEHTEAQRAWPHRG